MKPHPINRQRPLIDFLALIFGPEIERRLVGRVLTDTDGRKKRVVQAKVIDGAMRAEPVIDLWLEEIDGIEGELLPSDWKHIGRPGSRLK